MSAALVDNICERFAGQMSQGESRFCNVLRESLEQTLQGERSFTAEIEAIWSQLDSLRKFNFDVDRAIASGEFHVGSDHFTAPTSAATVLTAAEKSFLEDAVGLIDWVARNGVDFSVVLQVLGHDTAELSRHAFSLDRLATDFIVPKVSGWAKRNAEPLGESPESV